MSSIRSVRYDTVMVVILLVSFCNCHSVKAGLNVGTCSRGIFKDTIKGYKTMQSRCSVDIAH